MSFLENLILKIFWYYNRLDFGWKYEDGRKYKKEVELWLYLCYECVCNGICVCFVYSCEFLLNLEFKIGYRNFKILV